MVKLGMIWRNRKLILEGVANTVVKKKFIEDVAAYRMEICKSCKLGFYDGDCEVPGTGPCCGACGCSLKFKVRSMSSPCGAIHKDKQPLWLPVMRIKEEDEHLGQIERGE